MGKKSLKLAIVAIAIAALLGVAVPILASSSGSHAAPPEDKGPPSGPGGPAFDLPPTVTIEYPIQEGGPVGPHSAFVLGDDLHIFLTVEDDNGVDSVVVTLQQMIPPDPPFTVASVEMELDTGDLQIGIWHGCVDTGDLVLDFIGGVVVIWVTVEDTVGNRAEARGTAWLVWPSVGMEWEWAVAYEYQGEPYTDLNMNGLWDPGEPYDDLNTNGLWDEGEPYNDDVVVNGQWDPLELFNDLNMSGDWDASYEDETTFTSTVMDYSGDFSPFVRHQFQEHGTVYEGDIPVAPRRFVLGPPEIDSPFRTFSQVLCGHDTYLRTDTGRVEYMRQYKYYPAFPEQYQHQTNEVFFADAGEPLPQLVVGNTYEDDQRFVSRASPSGPALGGFGGLHQVAVVGQEDLPDPLGDGNLTCYIQEVWDTAAGELLVVQWIAPYVGLVKQIVYYYEGVETWELQSYPEELLELSRWEPPTCEP